ncbi:DNA-binding CsgD family transcriptional regulator [Rhodovulum iodosum]|uniref:DNA-binding CsgD family transcriptional regulator n=1 Tax=Rhodovulum iodosum TaxID=68291 RepID=A0ABV3XXH5_9RHOB|nr:helix-turn-helix transcriptional regulator [Rhodovulum robiginosum]RSK34197.1 LuxR family transcriptional regulator [Rhodovulum robiginosum]
MISDRKFFDDLGTGPRFQAADLARSIDAVTAWVGALHNQGAFEDSLARLAGALHSEIGQLVRYGKGNDKPRLISQGALHRDGVHATAPHFAQTLLGDQLFKARPGSIWLLSELRQDLLIDTALTDWLESRKLTEVVVVVLNVNVRHCDVLELCADRAPSVEDATLLKIVAPNLASSWRQRQPGIATREIGRKHARNRTQRDAIEVCAILDMSNPYDLSRSEYRICTLVMQGMNTGDISSELGISESTARSHLHSIYGKTGTTGIVGLMHRLMQSGPSASAITTGNVKRLGA